MFCLITYEHFRFSVESTPGLKFGLEVKGTEFQDVAVLHMKHKVQIKGTTANSQKILRKKLPKPLYVPFGKVRYICVQ